MSDYGLMSDYFDHLFPLMTLVMLYSYGGRIELVSEMPTKDMATWCKEGCEMV